MADLEEAAARLAAILRDEDAEVLTVYDERGTTATRTTSRSTGSGSAPAELAGTPRVYESTMNRDYIIELMQNRARGDGGHRRRARPRGDEPRHAGRR